MVLAKLVTYTVVGAGYGLTASVVTIAIALPWLASKHLHLVVGAGAIAATLAGVLAAVAIFGLLGVGLGALLREQVATVAGLLLYLFVVERVLTSTTAWSRWTSYLPGQAQEALVGSILTSQRLLQPWQGGILLVGYSLALAVAGTAATIRRDVT